MFSKHHTCTRRDQKHTGGIYDDSTGIVESFTAEVSITDNKDVAVVFGCETSLKSVSANDLAQLIFKTSIAVIHTDITDFDVSTVRKVEDYE